MNTKVCGVKVLPLSSPIMGFLGEWCESLVQVCYALTAELIARDPYALEAMPLHLVASLELGKKNELFLRSHK